MEEYLVRQGKRMRLGYTTGSCAAAAAKAAAWMLLTGRRRETIRLVTPSGVQLELALREITQGMQSVSCAVEKDGGDDPDITTGALIFASVSRCETPGITVDGGEGVGRVTRRGLDQPVGAAAINSVPRRMIEENVEEVRRLTGASCGLRVVISVPKGRELAAKTFNPRLGIEGGISILGTTGIVEPMSERALVDTIRVELRQHRANGATHVLLVPGNYGAVFAGKLLGVPQETAVLTSNFIGRSLELCRELGFTQALLVSHIGKLVKVAGGMLDTHSRYGDCRMEILAAYAGAAGLAPARITEILACVACDDALRILREEQLDGPVLQMLMERIGVHLKRAGGPELQTEAVMFSGVYGLLGRTAGAQRLEQEIARRERKA